MKEANSCRCRSTVESLMVCAYSLRLTTHRLLNSQTCTPAYTLYAGFIASVRPACLSGRGLRHRARVWLGGDGLVVRALHKRFLTGGLAATAETPKDLQKILCKTFQNTASAGTDVSVAKAADSMCVGRTDDALSSARIGIFPYSLFFAQRAMPDTPSGCCQTLQ